MKPFNPCVCLGLALLLWQGAMGQLSDEPVNPDNQKRYMKTSGVVVDICVYEQEYVPPGNTGDETIPFKEGTLIRRAVVTGVHKGDVEIGTKIEIVGIISNPPESMTKFRSVVEGELLTWFYFGEELPEPKNGRYVIDHNQMSFKRGEDKEVTEFLELIDTQSIQNDKANKPEMATPRKPSD